MDLKLFEIVFCEFEGDWAWMVIVDGLMYINTVDGVTVEEADQDHEKVHMWGVKT